MGNVFFNLVCACDVCLVAKAFMSTILEGTV